MSQLFINLLFRILGNSTARLYNIQYLYGASTQNHEARKRRWEKALTRLWKDKDMLDFLFYQAESDKENIFRGKIKADLSRGARIRTLFIVHSAHKAYLETIKSKRSNATEKSETDTEIRKTEKAYKQLVDI